MVGPWSVRYIKDHQFLIEDPKLWHKTVIEKGFVEFGPYWFSVSYDLSVLSAQSVEFDYG